MLNYLPHVLATIMTYYGLSTISRQVAEIVFARHRVALKLYKHEWIIHAAKKGKYTSEVLAYINDLNSVDAPIVYHPKLDPRHYGSVVASLNARAPYRALPNIRMVRITGRIPAIPAGVTHFDCDIGVIEMFVDNHPKKYASNYCSGAPIGDLFGPNIKYLKVRHCGIGGVSWKSIEHDMHYKAGPISPDDLVYIIYDPRYTLRHNMGGRDPCPATVQHNAARCISYYNNDEERLLSSAVRYKHNGRIVMVTTKRRNNDGTFRPDVYVRKDGSMAIDYSGVESSSITKIAVSSHNSAATVFVKLPRDCTNIVKFIVRGRSNGVVFHKNGETYNGKRFPSLDLVSLDGASDKDFIRYWD